MLKRSKLQDAVAKSKAEFDFVLRHKILSMSEKSLDRNPVCLVALQKISIFCLL